MLKKISREDCLKQYPVFPLRNYDEITDEEVFSYPKVISGKWVELDRISNEELAPSLAKELSKLIGSLGINHLVFLGDTEQSWVSKQGMQRADHPPFSNAIDYFRQNRIDTSFNGAVVVSSESLETFLSHFYTMVRCDASLPYFHFVDDDQGILGTIHYSGQIRIDKFNKKVAELVEKQLQNTGFKEVKFK